METLKKQLFTECSYRMKEETMDKFIGLLSDSRTLKEGEALIPYGKFENNIYVLKSGIMRLIYFDGMQERTFAFALPGTVMISYHSFYMRKPSFFQLEACCESVAYKISRDKFIGLMQESNDFSQWMLWMSVGQLWYYEMKLSVVNGNAKERFESLMKNRPEIIEKVQAKIVASYIGITPQYLCTLKRQFGLKSKGHKEALTDTSAG